MIKLWERFCNWEWSGVAFIVGATLLFALAQRMIDPVTR
jgi:hypothetical protein